MMNIENNINESIEKASYIDNKMGSALGKYLTNFNNFLKETGTNDDYGDIKAFIFTTYINAYLQAVKDLINPELALDVIDYINFEFNKEN